ncbi:uncharacterized protein EV154DRAFT_506933 [Mucor mucedo]|uniref:uncharacterized protein n=1 Tax=Mucor mucedo TaxID=29922 RepID=UPI00221EAC21|nr:uncharacterized protein EV154DRAFT_506933 [Mucor mucedo]KAI7891700.1 hypothetical protein EV154DRAFT_506933 [Mucor mucedo]
MEEQYDYSRHKYCIILVFGYNAIASDIVAIKNIVIEKEEVKRSQSKKTNVASLLYQTTTETVIASGELIEDSEGFPEGVIHIPNIFSELKRNYSNDRPNSHTHGVRYKNFLQEAINVLQGIPREWKEAKKCLDTDFYYAVIIPSNWEYETREEFFRPLLIKAGLIHEDDGQGRVVFFSNIEPIFRYIQEDHDILGDVEMKLGDQYVICTLDYQGTFCVNLELVSVQYHNSTVIESKWLPQSLKQVQFTIPFESRDLRSPLIAYLEKLCGNTIPSEIIEALLVIVSELSKDRKLDIVPSFFKPFHRLKNLYTEQYGLKESEIDDIQSITNVDIYKNVNGFTDNIFNYQMDILLQGTSNTKTRSMVIFDTEQVRDRCFSGILLNLIERWSETYREQKKSYGLIAKGEAFNYSRLQSSGILDLIAYQMQVFNIRRAPVILSNNTAIEHSKRFSKSTILINIDMLPTQTNTIVTYLDENMQAKQTKTFDCNMKPLDSFITYSKLEHRPILYINNSLKLLLENIFGDYLKLFSTSNRLSITRETLWSSVSTLLVRVSRKMPKSLLSNYYRIKSSANWRKEIRNVFVSSNPNLHKKLIRNVEMNDFLTSNDESCSANINLFTTSDPGYIFFFMITYLSIFNKLLEDKLEHNVGSKWKSNSIWCGVFIDKSLLDIVFGSIKNLEKSFFACGILQKGNNLRRAKFCTRGEEILPAIQQKLIDLEFKMKSYFVVAQVFSKHIQLTLHQVVILASSEENAATIVIQDDILDIDDVYDSLCKPLWKTIQSNTQVNYCAIHNDRYNAQHDLYTFQAYSDISQNLKLCVVKLLEMNKASVDMNSKIHLSISNKCTCSISVSLRDCIEVALVSVIENMATVIAASLTNKRLYGKYAANYIFVFGDPFNVFYGSVIHTIYTMLMQKTIDDAVQFKEKDTITFALGESLYQLLKPVTHTKPHMLEHFITGKLCRVSSETYALRVKESHTGLHIPFSRINRNGDIKNNLYEDGNYLVFIQKGKPVSTSIFAIQLQEHIDIFTLDIIQAADNSEAVVTKKYSVLDSNADGSKYRLRTNKYRGSISTIVMECKQIKYDLSLKLLRECSILYHDSRRIPLYDSLNIIEPLTLAYI